MKPGCLRDAIENRDGETHGLFRLTCQALYFFAHYALVVIVFQTKG